MGTRNRIDRGKEKMALRLSGRERPGVRIGPRGRAPRSGQERGPLAALTDWVLTHRRLVVAVWLAAAVAGAASASSATHALSQRSSLPGRPGFEANQLIQRLYGNGGATAPFVAVLTLPRGDRVDAPAVRVAIASAMRAVQTRLPGSRVVSYALTGDPRFASRDGRTSFALIYPPSQPDGQNPVAGALPRTKAALAGVSVGGGHFELTGVDPLSSNGSGAGQGVLVETLLGAVGALAVLAFVFGSLLAFVPLLIAAIAIPTCFLIIWAIASLTQVFFIVQYLVALIGLGVAIDYSLLVVVRWREERAHGLDNQEAVSRAMATAGRAVFFSGTTVAIGLVALLALPVPFLRSVGYAGMLIPLISVAVALTLLPVLLGTLGPGLDWPHRRSDERASRAWTRWGALITHHRWAAALAALAVLAALIVPVFSLKLDNPNVNALGKSGPAHRALVRLESAGIGPGTLSPIEVLTAAGTTRTLSGKLDTLPGAQLVTAPTGPAWQHGGRGIVDVLPRVDGSSSAGRQLLSQVRTISKTIPGAMVGGQEAQSRDFVAAVYGSFPLMFSLIALITFVLLARAFRSLLLPLKAVLLNILSLAAAWGVLVLIWQQGHGSHLLYGIAATGAITVYIPLLVFAFLFGLSMDYEVFILARIREEYDRTRSTSAAVVSGLGRTGRLVTSAALILFLAFLSLASGPETEVKILATALAAGVLLDATIIRALLVPALITLLDTWNWWLPRPLARMLRVPATPSHPPARATGATGR
jgi:RND superfamily putative drug exporter